MSADIDALLVAAWAARENAHAPYSQFRVGSAVATGDQVHLGCNVENASYGGTVCAERNAISAMIAAGENKPDAIVLVTDTREPVPPCGLCRQVIGEFGHVDLPVVAETRSGRRKEWRLGELLPEMEALRTLLDELATD